MDNWKFSVVISVYKNDKSEYFKEAVVSLLNQSLQPNEIIIVVDGEVTSQLNKLIEYFEALENVRVLRLAKNLGLGLARDYAIRQTKYSIVAVMDSDDISLPDRFSWQMKVLRSQDFDLVGGFIEEFRSVPGDCGLVRKVPLGHDDVISVGRWRQSINHVTIMFKKTAYFRSGGYHDVRGIEDYDLFYRFFITGSRVCNIDRVLVDVRFNSDTVLRRRGWRYYRAIVGIYGKMLKARYISIPRYLLLSLLQIFVRLSPPAILTIAYKIMRVNIGARGKL
jgi:glycosyltransferase involved in cell wall biosynthesis